MKDIDRFPIKFKTSKLLSHVVPNNDNIWMYHTQNHLKFVKNIKNNHRSAIFYKEVENTTPQFVILVLSNY